MQVCQLIDTSGIKCYETTFKDKQHLRDALQVAGLPPENQSPAKVKIP
jgi:hypothetical protein